MNLHVPPGHPYSPIPSRDDIVRTQDTDRPTVQAIPGIDLRIDQQWELLHTLLPLYSDVAQLLVSSPRFTLDNTWFTGADAVFMALMLRHLEPRRIVEVGSGYSSALIADTVPKTHLTCIDPDPQRVQALLGDEVVVIAEPAQDVDIAVFDALAAGDVLSIDSSHVMRAGSDVHHMLFTVLPRLPRGVHIQVHDIFFPFEYPREWLDAGVAFSEAYAWRAILMNSTRPSIELWNHLLITRDPDWFHTHMPLCFSAPFRTGGLWLCT
jgi:hypothetical protein